MKVTNRTALSTAEFVDVRRALPEHENLQQVMTWALADQSGAFTPGVVSQVIVQDEFSHDVIIPWRNALTLVFETT
jgi:hypothetical protein